MLADADVVADALEVTVWVEDRDGESDDEVVVLGVACAVDELEAVGTGVALTLAVSDGCALSDSDEVGVGVDERVRDAVSVADGVDGAVGDKERDIEARTRNWQDQPPCASTRPSRGSHRGQPAALAHRRSVE